MGLSSSVTTTQMAKTRHGASKGLTASSCSPHTASSHSLTKYTHSRTRLPIPAKYIFCCCSKAITNMAIFLANKSRTYRSCLDCQQNKGRTWQSPIQAESTDKQKPIAVCVCVHVQPPHTSSAPARCGLPATYSTEGQTFTICFFFPFCTLCAEDERLSEDSIYGSPSSLSTVISF